MKKILLTSLLILSTTLCIAQQEIVKKYTSMITISNDIKGEWVETDLTVSFNSKENKDIIFNYANGKSVKFHKIANMDKGTTINCDTYQLVQCLDDDNQRVFIQLFDNDAHLRVIIKKGYYIEFHRD
jgi:hypothetical protein